ncbi:MAG TPA: hypothetical protein VH092_31290, partial [Urbifossiella sp.]|nr:hypothetical protein [Urbifossiella sp.]
MTTTATSHRDQLRAQWVEHAEAVFDRLFPADQTEPLPTLDRLERTGEPSLLRALAGALDPGDVVLADRGFGSSYELALWPSGGVDAVVRMHQARRADFRTGRRLGARDHVVVWSRPDRPEWVDNALFRTLPRRLEVREVAVRVTQPG